MMKWFSLRSPAEIGSDDRGAALVEFAIVLPMYLLVFGIIVEGGRLFWSYQATIAGVRDASRYLARAVPSNICASGGSLAGYTTKVTEIVADRASGTSVFPSGISILSVTPSYTCTTGTYRGGTVAVAQVKADLRVTFPLAGLFTFYGSSGPGTKNTTVIDQSRIFGT